jgi:hypothetical protein
VPRSESGRPRQRRCLGEAGPPTALHRLVFCGYKRQGRVNEDEAILNAMPGIVRVDVGLCYRLEFCWVVGTLRHYT